MQRKKTWDNMTPKERDKYINQDQVKLGEFIPSTPVSDPWIPTGWCMRQMYMDDGEYTEIDPEQVIKIILELHEDGMKAEEIAYHIPYTKWSIHRIIRKYTKLPQNST